LIAPDGFESLMRDESIVDPFRFVVGEAATGNEHVDVGIKFKVSAEGMKNHDDAGSIGFVLLKPRLDGL